MKDRLCVEFLKWALPRLHMRWPGFRKVRRQVCKRIDRRLAELGLSGVDGYRRWLEEHPEEWRVIDGFCRISISRFYRDRGVFDHLRDEVLPSLAAAAKSQGECELRCWSAGCASGEEPYTVNIVWKLAAAPRAPGVTLTIVATDSDPHMLQCASRGRYSYGSLKDLPKDWLDACFTLAAGEYILKPEYRAGIEWLQHDIRREMPAGEFHLILCRHLVFTYFEPPLQQQVLKSMLARLRPGGILVTGKQEPLPGVPPQLDARRADVGIYQRR